MVSSSTKGVFCATRCKMNFGQPIPNKSKSISNRENRSEIWKFDHLRIQYLSCPWLPVGRSKQHQFKIYWKTYEAPELPRKMKKEKTQRRKELLEQLEELGGVRTVQWLFTSCAYRRRRPALNHQPTGISRRPAGRLEPWRASCWAYRTKGWGRRKHVPRRSLAALQSPPTILLS